jgi:hypothetical protein
LFGHVYVWFVDLTCPPAAWTANQPKPVFAAVEEEKESDDEDGGM